MKNPTITSSPPPIAPVMEDYGIEILYDGTWLYGGTPITRHNLVKLFATVLKKDAQGTYWLETPYEKGRIAVADVPFIAVEMTVEHQGQRGAQVLQFITNTGDAVIAGAGHPLRVETHPQSGAPAPYVHVRDNLEARIARAVFYDLVALAVPADDDPQVLGVWSSGVFFPLGLVTDMPPADGKAQGGT